jgi:hypothetical protein
MNSPVLLGDGRYALGMSFAINEAVEEMGRNSVRPWMRVDANTPSCKGPLFLSRARHAPAAAHLGSP